ncbi:hypothetical protein PIB30_056295 [Stylosanthes scabra]|uniref:Transposase n=1 Tax=Stylosanthes scabra TaxID=79078 RepID=A0ABU6XKA7_9FABA|nr:hypothetical protein [Stylosanthes scabra]
MKRKQVKVQKKRRASADKKLDVLIPLDKNVPVGEGANDFITSLSVIVHQHALQVVASWKDVPEEAKTRILANALKISARNKENRAKQVINHCCGRKTFQAVSYENRDPLTGIEPNYQQLWQIAHIKKNGCWIDKGSEEVDDKVSTLVLEKLQDVDEDIDQTTIVNEAFVSIVGQKLGYCRGRGKGPKPVNKYGACIQEQLATQQREANEARRRTSELLTTLEGVQAQLMEEREKREEMEARFNERQKKMQETMGNQVQEAIRIALSQFHRVDDNINKSNTGERCSVVNVADQGTIFAF